MGRPKIKVLVVSYHPWRDDISLGNSLSNIFRGMEDRMEFANVYVRDDKPSNDLTSRQFHISEMQMFRNILRRKEVGEEVAKVEEHETKENFSKGYNQARKLRWDILLLIQDVLGLMCKWQSKALDHFIGEVQPDLIFGPLGRVPISNKVMIKLSRQHHLPLIVYPWDDHYSLKKRSYDPFFWIRLLVERSYIRKCAKQSEYLYTITSLMAREYSHYFKRECRLLCKGYNFDLRPEYSTPDGVIQIKYMGNIGDKRWKTLHKIATIVNDLNRDGVKFKMDIHTMSPLTDEMRRALNVGACRLLPPVPSSEVTNTMKGADILLHVEPLSRREQLLYRLSFSTKIVDYLFSARCILAVGANSGSIDYLKENDCALVANDVSEVSGILSRILSHRDLLQEYSQKAWKSGLRNHQIRLIQERLYTDFTKVKEHADGQI